MVIFDFANEGKMESAEATSGREKMYSFNSGSLESALHRKKSQNATTTKTDAQRSQVSF
jgi:hypothetical protein